jgi:hypothetical protein
MRYASPVAREKNTSRAEARKRTREMTRAELLAAEAEDELGDDGLADAAAQPDPPRAPMFKMPNILSDLRALPSIFRSRKMLWLPLVLLLVGTGITLALPGLSPDMAAFGSYYIQFFFQPPALFTFFIAGFFAPRASYLIGFIYGVIAGVLWAMLIITGPPIPILDPAVPPPTPVTIVINYVIIGALYGTLAAALAAWYRDFLRGMQERGRARRGVKEVDERSRRREERQEARRLAKQRPTPPA